MKIGMIAPPWVPVPPHAYGGTELAIDLLCRGLTKAGHEVKLFTTGDSTCPVPRLNLFPEAEGFKGNGTISELRHVFAAYRSLQDMDIIHDHTLMGPLISQPLGSPPVVTTNHGPFQHDTMAIWQAMADRNVPIIAISRHQASTADGIAIERVIHHGLDPSAFKMGAGRGGYLASLGRMAPEKGIHTACQVAREVGMPLKIGAKMREPKEVEYFERYVEPLLGDGIEYLGELNQHEKVEFLQGATALLNPISWAEPFGLVMTEAMVVGTPVIATRCGSVPEIVNSGRTGFVCESLEEMVEAVGKIDTIRREDCRAEVEKSFSVEAMTDKHVRLYQAVRARRMSTQPRRTLSSSIPK